MLPGIAFMNSGWAETDGHDYAWVRGEDRRHKYHLNLIRRAFGNIDIAGRLVLEIGSGRGGNCDYLSRYTAMRRGCGVDSSPANVRSAANTCSGRVSFVRADAGMLPFARECFDVVLNIEWSPTYPSFRELVSEAARVLVPSGIFVYADLWNLASKRSDFADRERILANGPFEVMSEEDYSEHAFRALDATDGLVSNLKAIENEDNAELIGTILREAEAAKANLAIGRITARNFRLRKRRP